MRAKATANRLPRETASDPKLTIGRLLDHLPGLAGSPFGFLAGARAGQAEMDDSDRAEFEALEKIIGWGENARARVLSHRWGNATADAIRGRAHELADRIGKTYDDVLDFTLPEFVSAAERLATPANRGIRRPRRRTLPKERQLTEKETRLHAYGQCGTNIAAAARMLGKDRTTISEQIKNGLAKLGRKSKAEFLKFSRLPSDSRGQATIAARPEPDFEG